MQHGTHHLIHLIMNIKYLWEEKKGWFVFELYLPFPMISFYSGIQFSKFHFIAKRQEICLGKRSFFPILLSILCREWVGGGMRETAHLLLLLLLLLLRWWVHLSLSLPLHLSLLSMAYALSNDVPLCKLCPSLQCCLHRFIHVWRRFVIFSSHMIFRLKMDHKCFHNCLGGVITMHPLGRLMTHPTHLTDG